MELDDLKTNWRDLDGRLAGANEKIDRLTARVTAGKVVSAKQRLRRTILLGLAMLSALPMCLLNISRNAPVEPGVAVKVLLALFIMVMLGRQVFLMILLARIDPARQSVYDACVAVLRFRMCFFVGVGIGVAVAVPLLVALGIYCSRLDAPYILYGYVSGLVVGIPLGVRIFLRKLSDINDMRAALQNTEKD